MTQPAEPLADRVYVELVRTLYRRRVPALIMACVFALAVMLIYGRFPRAELLVLGGLGISAACARLLVLYANGDRALTAPLDRPAARHLEKLTAVPTVAFALSLGAFGAAVFRLPSPEAHMLIVALTVGYCAGVATGMGLRPRIAIPCMIAAVFPIIAMGVLQFESLNLGTSAVLAAYLAGGAHTVRAHFATVSAEVAKRVTFGSLARQDGLTALPNRLALREYFDEHTLLSPPGRLVAVHYLDLDGFKPVNDRFGHATGDALLAAVAARLKRAVRSEDIIARLGGDEFAVLQFGLQRVEDAQLLALRATAALRQPFRIGPHRLSISASIGTVTRDVGESHLDDMLAEADRQLYVAKRARAEARRSAA